MAIQGGGYGTLQEQQAKLGNPTYGTISYDASKGKTGKAGYDQKKDLGYTPTVLSDTNVRDNLIPDIKAKAQKLLTDFNDYKAGQDAKGNNDGTPTGDTGDSPDSAGMSEYDKLYQSAFGSTPQQDPYYDSEMNLLDQMKGTSDRRTARALDSISGQFKTRKADVQASETSSEAQVKNALFRAGGRYDPSGSSGIMSANQRGYIRDLSAIDLQEQQAKNEALQAQEDNNFKLLGEKLDVLSAKRKEKMDTVNKLYDNIIDQKKQVSQISEDLAKNGAPAEVIKAAGSASNVADAIQAGVGYFQDPTSDAGQYQAYVKDATAKGLTPMLPGDWIAKQASNRAYASAYASAKGKNAADAEAETSSGAAYNGDFQATVKLASNIPGLSNAQRVQTEKDLEGYIANKDWGSAYTQIQSSTAAKLKGAAATNFQNQQQSLTAVQDMDKALTALHDAGYDTNKLTGGMDKIGTTLGTLSTYPKYAQVASQAYSAFQQYRQNMTGAAFGAKESAEYASVLPNPSNTFELNKAKIAGAKDYLNGQIEGAIRNNIGQGGVEIKKYAEGAGNVPDAASTVNNYVTEHPEEADSVAKLYELPGWTDQDVLDYLNSQQ